MVPVLFFGFFYYFQRKDDSTLGYKYKHILELEEKVECYYKIDDHKVYIIQKDSKRIELNQYWYLKLLHHYIHRLIHHHTENKKKDQKCLFFWSFLKLVLCKWVLHSHSTHTTHTTHTTHSAWHSTATRIRVFIFRLISNHCFCCN